MFPNVNELTKAVQANTELMAKLLAELKKLNTNTERLAARFEATTSSGLPPR